MRWMWKRAGFCDSTCFLPKGFPPRADVKGMVRTIFGLAIIAFAIFAAQHMMRSLKETVSSHYSAIDRAR